MVKDYHRGLEKVALSARRQRLIILNDALIQITGHYFITFLKKIPGSQIVSAISENNRKNGSIFKI